MPGAPSTPTPISPGISADPHNTPTAVPPATLHPSIPPPSPVPTWELVVDQTEITRHLITRNNQHFGQANGTPFTRSPLIDIVGRNAQHGLASIPTAATLASNSAATTTLLHLLQDYTLDPISCQFTGAELKHSFQRWREAASTSPAGTHMGLYKALVAADPPTARLQDTPLPVRQPTTTPPTTPHHLDNTPTHTATSAPPHLTGQSNTHPSHATTSREHSLLGPQSTMTPIPPNDEVFEILAMLLTMAFTYGVTFEKWSIVHNAMIEKIPGNPRIDKLRMIHIMDALWNQGMGMLWARRLQPHCEHHNALHDGQWGSRQGRQCIDVVTLKQSTYELSRLTRTDLITFDNDAKSCYDRIVMAYALLWCQQVGLPPSAAQAFGRFLDHATYHLKTKLGVSAASYSSSAENPLHGLGQGNRNDPSLWGIISTALMDALKTRHTGVNFSDPAFLDEVQRIIDGFVDDTTLWANNFHRKFET